MHRRQFMTALGATFALHAWPWHSAWARENVAKTRIAAAWRGASPDSPQRIGVIDVDWDARSVRIAAEHVVPGRAHGILAEADGGWVAVAYRFGRWLWRFDAGGAPMRKLRIDDEAGGRLFSGHVIRSADGSTLLTTELDPATGDGFVGVRDPRTLAKLDEWHTGGGDPHQLLVDPDGDIVLANGGVLRTPDDRKRDLDRMDPSLVVLDARSGTIRGQWRLRDPKLSLRHLAYRSFPGEPPLLGIALQAEHADARQRAQAPVLATFDGERLSVPSASDAGAGYAGDIVAAPGGFVVSCQPAGRALWWRRDAPAQLATIAELRQACALGALPDSAGAVIVGGAVGVGRWHPQEPAALLPWPQPMALDNHWAMLAA